MQQNCKNQHFSATSLLHNVMPCSYTEHGFVLEQCPTPSYIKGFSSLLVNRRQRDHGSVQYVPVFHSFRPQASFSMMDEARELAIRISWFNAHGNEQNFCSLLSMWWQTQSRIGHLIKQTSLDSFLPPHPQARVNLFWRPQCIKCYVEHLLLYQLVVTIVAVCCHDANLFSTAVRSKKIKKSLTNEGWTVQMF